MLTRQMYGLGDVANDTWPSTGEIDTETRSLDLTIKQASADAFSSDLPGFGDTSLQNAWNAFIADWNQWKDSSWFWNPGRRDELLGYRKRFNTLIAQLQAAGTSSMITPTQTGATAPGPDALDKLSDIATKAMYVVLGIGVLWAAHTVYKEMRG